MQHEEANSWLCPGCGQYNGWTQDGNYNRDLSLDTEDGRQQTLAYILQELVTINLLSIA